MSAHHHHGSTRRILVAFVLNLFFSLFEIVGGVLTGSTAIISDAIHDLGDAATLGLSWFMERYSHKRRDATYTFGYRRFSLLASLLHAAILLVGIVIVLTRAIPALLDPPAVDADTMIYLAALGIVVNVIGMLTLHRGHSSHEKMITLHLLEDVLGWAAVLAVSIFLQFIYLPILDPILAILIAMVLAVSIIRQAKEVSRILMQAAPSELDSRKIAEDIQQRFSISDVHDMHIWSLDGQKSIASFHIRSDEQMDIEALFDMKSEIKQYLNQAYGLDHVAIDAERSGDSCNTCD
jgi:cobalt-zinc-cadmium efflux system protein